MLELAGITAFNEEAVWILTIRQFHAPGGHASLPEPS
jgi:hypothetical protein